MRDRSLLGALLLIGTIVPFTGCGNPTGLDSISVSPSTQSLTAGQTAQLTATGTFGNSSHASTQNVTGTATWSSNTPGVATVSGSGLVTAVSAGSAVITASAQGFNGPVSSSSSITVTSTGGTVSGGSVVSIAVTPGTQAVAGGGQTVQFIAIGTTTSGATVDLTGAATWTSSAASVATIVANTGIATSVAAGTTTITALYTANGTTVAGTASLTVTGGVTGGFISIQIIPNSQTLSASGQTGQFIALGTTSSGVVEDVTDSPNIVWSSSIPTIATVSATGLASGVSPGTDTITALITNTDGSVSIPGTATVDISLTAPPEAILSLEIIPGSITVNNFNLAGQFIAVGTFSAAPFVRDVTNLATTTWLSSEPNLFPVNNNTGGGPGASAGIVTAEGAGNSTIIAESASPDGTIQTATATFNCPQLIEAVGSTQPPSCPDTLITGSPLLSTLTIYQRGLNTTTWQVTASSATGTPDVLHCGPGYTGPGGSVCTATYPAFDANGNPTQVVLTSPAGAGAFGGWSTNCVPTAAITAAGPNSCTVTLAVPSAASATPIPSDDVVGIIVN